MMATTFAPPPNPSARPTVDQLASVMSLEEFDPTPVGEIIPLGPGAATPRGVSPGDLPKTIDELPVQLSRAYDLSVTAAADLNIPVIGSVGGGYGRRVVVLERTAYKELSADGLTYQYGYAIRLAVTVNKLSGEMKLTLPFLAASAEMGHVEAKWTLQVLGLSGSRIDAVSITPTELNVETFVLAKQSLTNLIAAIRDSTTRFNAQQIAVVKPRERIEREYRVAVGTAYALGRLERGRRRGQALSDIGSATGEVHDAVYDVYKDLAGITDDSASVPAEAQSRAGALLAGVQVKPR